MILDLLFPISKLKTPNSKEGEEVFFYYYYPEEISRLGRSRVCFRFKLREEIKRLIETKLGIIQKRKETGGDGGRGGWVELCPVLFVSVKKAINGGGLCFVFIPTFLKNTESQSTKVVPLFFFFFFKK